MAIQNAATLKGYFNTGDTPTETNFADLVDSALQGVVQVPNAGGNNYILNPTDNTLDSTVSLAVILAPGRATEPNRIGTATQIPTGTDFSNSTLWAADSAYPAGAADVAGILSGYDNISNQIASSIMAGGHNMISYNIDGHSLICGGSYNWISGSAGRTVIVHGRNCRAQGGTAFTFGLIGTGTDHVVGATCATVLNGNRGNVTGSLSTIVNGNDNTVTHSRVLMMGDYGVSSGDRSITLSADRLVEAGDMQNTRMVQGCRTLDATATFTSGATTATRYLTLGAGKFGAWLVRVNLIAKRDGTADANNDNNNASAAWSGEFLVEWNGSAYIASATGTNGPATVATLALTAVRDNIGITTAPVLYFSSSALRCQVVGLAGVRINWVASFDATQTMVS